MFPPRKCLYYQRQILLIGKEWKMVFKANRTRTQATIPIRLCDKMDFKPKLGRSREAFVPIKQTTHQEDIILNTHTLDLNFIKQMTLDVLTQISLNTIIMLTSMSQSHQ